MFLALLYLCVGVWVYDVVGKRLFGPMVIWTMLTLLSLVGSIVLYKQLGPRKVSNKSNSNKEQEDIDSRSEEEESNGAGK